MIQYQTSKGRVICNFDVLGQRGGGVRKMKKIRARYVVIVPK